MFVEWLEDTDLQEEYPEVGEFVRTRQSEMFLGDVFTEFLN